MYRIECTPDIEKFKNIWNDFYLKNTELSPFQSYLWNNLLIKHNIYKGKLNFWILYNNDIPLIIAPLVKKKHYLYNELEFIGINTHSDYLNFIYKKDFKFHDLEYFIKEILHKNPRTIFNINLIYEKSIIADYINSINLPNRKCKDTLCVKIPIYQTIEDYTNNIGKRTKRTLKDGQKKLEKNFNNIDFVFYYEVPIEEPIINQAMDLYYKRCAEKNTFYDNNYKSFLKESLCKSENIFMSACYINQRLAAFYLAFKSVGQDIYANLTALDTDFGEYKIGYTLLYKTICFLIQKNTEIPEELKIKFYDLSRGEERYKYELKGIDHFSSNYELSNNRLFLSIISSWKRLKFFTANPKILMIRLSERKLKKGKEYES